MSRLHGPEWPTLLGSENAQNPGNREEVRISDLPRVAPPVSFQYLVKVTAESISYCFIKHDLLSKNEGLFTYF